MALAAKLIPPYIIYYSQSHNCFTERNLVIRIVCSCRFATVVGQVQIQIHSCLREAGKKYCDWVVCGVCLWFFGQLYFGVPERVSGCTVKNHLHVSRIFWFPEFLLRILCFVFVQRKMFQKEFCRYADVRYTGAWWMTQWKLGWRLFDCSIVASQTVHWTAGTQVYNRCAIH